MLIVQLLEQGNIFVLFTDISQICRTVPGIQVTICICLMNEKALNYQK